MTLSVSRSRASLYSLYGDTVSSKLRGQPGGEYGGEVPKSCHTAYKTPAWIAVSSCSTAVCQTTSAPTGWPLSTNQALNSLPSTSTLCKANMRMRTQGGSNLQRGEKRPCSLGSQCWSWKLGWPWPAAAPSCWWHPMKPGICEHTL